MMRIVLAALIFASCAAKTNSRTKYLSEKDYSCHEPSEARLSAVKAMLPNGFVSPAFGAEAAVVVNRLAGIPDAYLKHLIERFNSRQFSGIAPAALQGSVAGLTVLQGTSADAMYAKSISIRPNSVGFALQHEIGHALETFVKVQSRRESIDFRSGFESIFSEANSTPGIRPYARSTSSESWAEAFANFYCSSESKQFIDGKMPQTSGFLARVLLPPQWLETDSNKPSISQDVFIRLSSAGSGSEDVPFIDIATPSTVQSIELCEPGADLSCTTASASYQRIESRVDRGGRRIFTSQSSIQLRSSMALLFVGKNTAGELVVSRLVKVRPR